MAGLQSGVRSWVIRMLWGPLRWIAQVHLSCSRAAGEFMFGRRSKTRVVPNGVDLARFVYSPANRLATRRDLGLTDFFVVGHVGGFSEAKNHVRLLRIFADVLKRESSAKLLLVGDGPLRGEIEADIATLGIGDAVVLAGTREDVPDLLATMDALLFPSLHEGFPVALIEAQASGLPCLVSSAVTREIALTDLVRFVALDEPDDVWVDAVLAMQSIQGRSSRAGDLTAAGYDSTQVAQEMQTLYLDLSEAMPTAYATEAGSS